MLTYAEQYNQVLATAVKRYNCKKTAHVDNDQVTYMYKAQNTYMNTYLTYHTYLEMCRNDTTYKDAQGGICKNVKN